MKPYPTYKPSNIPWLGDVPEHWEEQRLNSIFSENKNANSDLCEKNTLQFRFGEIISKPKFEENSSWLETIKKYHIVHPNDILVNGLNLNYDFLTQRVAIVRTTGIITSAYISITPREQVNPDYYCYLLKTIDAKKILNGLGSGIRFTLDYNELKKQFLPLPPLPEQTQIVRYLDWQVSRIGKLISAKKKQIALLKEQKQAIINKAVTKGGEGWSLKRLRNISRIKTGSTPSGNEGINVEGIGFNWYTPSDFGNSLNLSTAKKFIDDKVVRRDNIQLFDEHSILFIGIGGTLGKVAYCNVPSYSNQQITAIIPNGVSSHYLLYCLLAKQQFIKDTANYTTLPIINNAQLSNIEVMLPPLTEQQSIVSYLDDRSGAIDKLTMKLQDEITLFTEYCTRLISDVVTGKIDVRDVQVPKFEAVKETVDDMPEECEITEKQEFEN
jgi:type I restriction enzyme S subunit